VPRTATYIYCLVDADRRPSLARIPRGVPGATAPQLLEIAKSLWAVVAEVPLALYGPDRLKERLQDIAWVADIAVAHEAVVEHCAAAKRVSVIPMKLFTMFSSPDRLLADLRARRDEVQGILKRIRGCQEWGVRVTYRDSAGRPRGAAVRGQRQPTSGTAFLAAKKSARDAARQNHEKAARAAETALRTLTRLARSAQRREAPPGATTPPLVDAALLVTTQKRARFRAAAGRLATVCRKAHAELLLTGPWPAYNFVQSVRESA
jgi:hypothetical protein